MDISELKRQLEEHGQTHLLQFWETLNPQEQRTLYDDLMHTDIPSAIRYFNATMQSSTTEKLDERMEPIPEEQCSSANQTDVEDVQSYREIGYESIRDGKVASLLLAGGQGTRLGVDYPKGMYDVGLPSHKTLFEIQAQGLQRAQELAGTPRNRKIPLYIMTSEGTKEPTLSYFRDNNYFGLAEDDVIVFEQGMLPTFTFDGKMILQSKHKLAKAPDGNGGLYKALLEQGILEDMKSRGIEYVHVYCVDNILVKMVDPLFLGYCIAKEADAGAKVVQKTNPTEPVGVFCKVDGKYQVVEYSEITSKTAERRNQKTGELLFNAGNICNHFFTVDFLGKLLSGLEDTLIHHVAKKKIPFLDSSGAVVNPKSANGIKLEKFVFDVFRFSETFAVWEVPREQEFSPLKNSDVEYQDTPTTCRNQVFLNNLKYLQAAGAKFSEDVDEQDLNNNNNFPVVEISPLVSYAGEGLEYVTNNFGKLKTPLLLIRKGEKLKHSENNHDLTVIEI